MTASIATVLARVTGELRRIETRLPKLEHAIGDVVLDAQSSLSRRFHDLQELDRARQEVAGVVEFLDNLAADLPPEWLVNAGARAFPSRLKRCPSLSATGRPLKRR